MTITKYALWVCCVLMVQVSLGQTLNPVPIPCENIVPQEMNSFNGIKSAVNCMVDDNNQNQPINIGGNQNVELKAGEEIYLDGEVFIHPNQNGEFYGHIEKAPIEVAWFDPNSTPGVVPRYEKMELGVNLAEEVNQAIVNFVEDQGVTPALNPFNPDEISVKAEIWYQHTTGNGNQYWIGPVEVFGFYYKEFQHNLQDPDPNEWDWDEVVESDNVNSDYNFRVRFAPPEIGKYKCKISAEVQGSPVVEASEFTFECIPSSKHGYMYVGQNKRFFMLDGAGYFPVGRNIPGPICWYNDIIGDPWDCQQMSCAKVEPWCTNKSPKYQLAYQAQLEDYKANGGEYFRYMNYADRMDIEFEELNNYYDRLTHAWEMDRLIDKVEELGLMMHFNLQNHTALEGLAYYGFFRWDFPDNNQDLACSSNDGGYCYSHLPGVNSPVDFFTDPEARINYKRRLRYITSRWGYSTSISVFELFSEINNAGQRKNDWEHTPDQWGFGCSSTGPDDSNSVPYADDPTVPAKVAQWQSEMCNYLKHHQYFPHLTAVSYTGKKHEDVGRGDYSYYSEDVDIASSNFYKKGVNIDQDSYKENKKWHGDMPYTGSGNNAAHLIDINKPFIHSEMGVLGIESCNQGVEFIKEAWATSFTGIGMTGLQWNYWGRFGLTQHQANIQAFMQGINYDGGADGPWTSQVQERRGDKYATMYCLVSNENKKRVIGSVINNTLNYYTLANGSPCDTMSPNSINFRTSRIVSPNTWTADHPGNNKIKVKGLGTHRYVVEWYNAMTMAPIGNPQTKWSVGGKLRLDYPELYASMVRPIVAFKIRRKNEPAFIPENNNQEEQNNLMEFFEPPIASNNEQEDMHLALLNELNANKYALTSQFTVVPNPSSGEFTLNFENTAERRVRVVSLLGEEIINTTTSENTFKINLDLYASGVYLLLVEQDGIMLYDKLIKN